MAFTAFSCANVGNPDGGPKDIEPPYVVKSEPAMNALNFTGRKVLLTFNELVVLKDLNKNFVVSPPLLREPVVKALGKVLSIDLNNDLQPNTTYTLYFGNAIVDNNEGNVLQNYAFSFATGNVIDTLMVSGFLLNAGNLNPVKNATIGLYRNLSDTAFTNDVPVRIARTDDKGHFIVRNISEGQYKIRGLKEMVVNYRFDQPGEEIAFSDTIFKPFHTIAAWPDTVFKDSITIDSVVFRDTLLFKPDSLLLFSFVEKDRQQRLIKKDRPKPYQMGFYFSNHIGDKMRLRFVDSLTSTPFLYEPSITGDTVSVWITDSTVYNNDSLELICRYQATDSLFNLQWREDTLPFNYRRPKVAKKNKDKDLANQAPEYEVKNLFSTTLPPGDNFLRFSLAEPLLSADMQSFRIFLSTDTLKTPLPVTITGDTLYSREMAVYTVFKPGLTYKTQLDSGALKSIYGLCSSKLDLTLNIKKVSDYCSLKFSLKHLTSNGILQILGADDKPIRSQIVTSGKPLVQFNLLDPGTYYARIILDTNNNGVWDTGDYRQQLQPETVLYFGKSFDTRGNWSYDEVWDITELPVLDQKPAKLRKVKSEKEN